MYSCIGDTKSSQDQIYLIRCKSLATLYKTCIEMAYIVARDITTIHGYLNFKSDLNPLLIMDSYPKEKYTTAGVYSYHLKVWRDIGPEWSTPGTSFKHCFFWVFVFSPSIEVRLCSGPLFSLFKISILIECTWFDCLFCVSGANNVLKFFVW